MKSGKLLIYQLFLLIILIFPANINVSGQDSRNTPGKLFQGGEKHRQMEDDSPFSGIEWISIGPSFQGGRIETIDCPVDQPGVIYAGFGSGSLWKTTNQGFDWECIFHNEHTSSIGDLAISVSNPEVLYLGTGESLRASRGFSLPGTGIYKSTDGGQTWYHKGLNESQHIGRVVVDPTDPDIVFVAVIGNFWSKSTQRGLFMSKNGGQSWQNILYISDSTGVVDLAWDATNKILYAASWDMVSGRNSGIHRTKNLGYDWERIESGLPVSDEPGRIGLAISPSRPEIVYAVVDNRKESTSMLTGAEVYRSDDFGVNWKKTHDQPLDNYSGFGYAFGDIRVAPFDHNRIYLPGIYLMESYDGGKTFSRMGGKVTHIRRNKGKTLHLDQHELYIDPLHPDYMILGNDGGVYITYNRGESWTHCNTIPAGEFYDISIVDGDTVRIYGGTQDNSSIMGLLIPEEPLLAEDSWRHVWLDPWSGGDGFTTFESPSDPNTVYYESQNGYLSLKNMISGETKHIKPSPDEDENPLRNSWFTPYFISAHDNKTLYYAANKVYKSINKGESWIRLSHDLCYSEDKARNSRSITSIAESPLTPGLLFAGTKKAAVWVSRNDGVRWFEISDGIEISKIVNIIPGRHNSSHVYIVAKGMDNDDYNPYIYFSGNLGKNWTLLSAGLPYESVNCLLEDPVIEGLIYAGTDRGIYCSPDNGRNWLALGKTLPTASVHKLSFFGRNKYILAATHGMSLFMAHTEPIRSYYANSAWDKAFFMTATDGRLPVGKDFSGDFDLETTRNISISFNWPSSEPIEIKLLNGNGEVVYSVEEKSSVGINQWTWDLKIRIEEDNTLYPVPEIIFPETGYYTVAVEGPSGKIRGPVKINR